METRSIGKPIAIALYNSKWWEGCPPEMIAFFQLFTEELCCPFDVFHSAVESLLERGVLTHEFGSIGIEKVCTQAIEKLTQRGTV